MKKMIIALIFSISLGTVYGQAKDNAQVDKNKPLLAVEASCGQCKFGLAGSSCDLAVRIDGKAYFVDGTSIDKHGDAHADDGFCNAVRKAEVQGQVVNGRFKSTYFKLLPEAKKD